MRRNLDHFGCQGSTKLEKAEILQMTVEHLRMLNSKGLNGYSSDPNALALDYRGTGYRECVAEVARYLSGVEGMDFNDPLRLRLLGHLEAYNVQRDATAKANIHSLATWNSAWSAAGLHGGNASFSNHHHSKLSSYGFGSKPSGLGQLQSLIGSAGSQAAHQPMDNAYLAASRLHGSSIGLTNHTPRPVTSSNLSHHLQSAPALSNDHLTASAFGAKLGTCAPTHFGSTHAHMKHASDVKHVNAEYIY